MWVYSGRVQGLGLAFIWPVSGILVFTGKDGMKVVGVNKERIK